MSNIVPEYAYISNYLYKLSLKHAPNMPETYHNEFIRVALDMMKHSYTLKKDYRDTK